MQSSGISHFSRWPLNTAFQNNSKAVGPISIVHWNFSVQIRNFKNVVYEARSRDTLDFKMVAIITSFSNILNAVHSIA